MSPTLAAGDDAPAPLPARDPLAEHEPGQRHGHGRIQRRDHREQRQQDGVDAVVTRERRVVLRGGEPPQPG
jgi:hypothetical protein